MHRKPPMCCAIPDGKGKNVMCLAVCGLSSCNFIQQICRKAGQCNCPQKYTAVRQTIKLQGISGKIAQRLSPATHSYTAKVHYVLLRGCFWDKCLCVRASGGLSWLKHILLETGRGRHLGISTIGLSEAIKHHFSLKT